MLSAKIGERRKQVKAQYNCQTDSTTGSQSAPIKLIQKVGPYTCCVRLVYVKATSSTRCQ